MSDVWYGEGNATTPPTTTTVETPIGCCYQNAPPAATACSTYDNANVPDMTKNQDVIPSPIINSNVFQNCFYSQPQEYSSAYPKQQEIGIKSECFDENGLLLLYAFCLYL